MTGDDGQHAEAGPAAHGMTMSPAPLRIRHADQAPSQGFVIASRQ